MMIPFLSYKDGATEIYLIRHADALPGAETVIVGGSYDAQPLSKLGQAQAVALGDWLKVISFEAIYSSPLRRTQETAAPLAAHQNLTVQLEPNLREVKLSINNNLDTNEAAATSQTLRKGLQAIVQQIIKSGKWSSIEGSEDSSELRQRMVKVVSGLAEQHAGGRIALFSHGGSINAYLAELLGLELDFFFSIYNTSVSIVRYKAGQVSLVSLNEIGHLRAASVQLED